MKRTCAILFAAVGACGGPDEITDPGASVYIPGSSMDVVGLVVNRFAEPVSRARVRIGTADAVTTDSRGRFIVLDAPRDYDASVAFDDPAVATNGPQPIGRAFVYQGLTRRHPVLFVPGSVTPGPGSIVHSTPVSISVTGNAAESTPLLWAFTNPSGFVAVGAFTSAPMFFVWHGARTALNRGSIVALAAASAGGPIVASGHAPASATDAPLSVTVPLAFVDAFNVSGTSRPSAGCTLGSHEVVVPASDGTTPRVAGDFAVHQPGASADFLIAAGFTNEVPLSLRVSATCPGSAIPSFVARRVSLARTSFVIDVPAPPRIVAPAAGAIAAPGTRFTWTAPAGAMSVVHFDRIDQNGSLLGTLDVATASTSITFPDLAALGATVLPGFALQWRVEAWGGVPGTDGLAASTGFGALLAGTANFSHGISEPRLVTLSR